MASPKMFHSGCLSGDKVIWKHVVVKFELPNPMIRAATVSLSVFIGAETLSVSTLKSSNSSTV